MVLNEMPLKFHPGIILTEMFSSVAFRDPSVCTLAQRAGVLVFVTELRDCLSVGSLHIYTTISSFFTMNCN